jgi:hypothetical protein
LLSFSVSLPYNSTTFIRAASVSPKGQTHQV